MLILTMFLILLWLAPLSVEAACVTTAATTTSAENFLRSAESCDLNGNQRTTAGTLAAGEDQTNNVQKVEGQFTHSTIVTADAQVKATAGFLHCILISQNDAAPTAGTIIIYDSAAESGTQVFNWTLTTAVFNPLMVCPDIIMTTGIYIGFTTTADVNVSVSYR